ncbi:ubiquitin-protein transferase activating protein [Dissophora globulifera]|nr:ubiquitin-protein transferase activating protein [Dissophora globulifera]
MAQIPPTTPSSSNDNNGKLASLHAGPTANNLGRSMTTTTKSALAQLPSTASSSSNNNNNNSKLTSPPAGPTSNNLSRSMTTATKSAIAQLPSAASSSSNNSNNSKLTSLPTGPTSNNLSKGITTTTKSAIAQLPSTASSSSNNNNSKLDTLKLSFLGKRNWATAALAPTTSTSARPSGLSEATLATPRTGLQQKPQVSQNQHSLFSRAVSAGPQKSLAAQAASSLTRTISSGGLTTKLEVVKNDWLSGGTSPKRGRKVYNQDSVGGRAGDHASAVRKIYSRHSSFTRSTSNLLLNKKRTILTSPEKVLDAPGLMDDYYLNLLDWSCSNMVAIGLDKSVFVWDAETGHAESLFTLPGNTDAIASVSWAFDGLFLAVGTFNGDTQIWDIETKTKVRSMTGHVSRVGALAWDKHILSSGSRDGSIWNHDVRVQSHKIAELSNHTNEVCGLVWRADGQQLASGGNDNLVNIWDARSNVPKYTKSNHTAAVKALAWCPWQNNLLGTGGGTYDKQIHFWNTSTGARVNTVNAGSQVTSIIWSTEYREFMSSHGYPDNNISVYGYPSMNKVIDIPAHDSRILHTAISPDGQTVATVASDENLKFWKLFERQSKNKKDGKRSGTLTRSASFCNSGSSIGNTGLGNDDDDERGGGSGGPEGTTIKGKTLSTMTRIR